MKKRILALMLVGCFALTACGSKEKTEEAASDTEVEADAEEEDVTEESITDMTSLNGISVVDVALTAETVEEFVTMGDYKGLKLEKAVYEVTEEDIDAKISSELSSRPIENKDPSAVVELGDTINLDYSGSIDGVVFEGGTAQSQTLEIGSGSFIPGFEDQMIGMHVGESGDIEVTFPEDYRAADLAGKDAVFAVTVNAINQYVEEVTEEWLLANSEYTAVDEYRESIRKTLEEQNAVTADNDIKNAAWQTVSESASYTQYPKELVDTVYAEIKGSYEAYAAMYGMEYEAFLEEAGYTEDMLMADVENNVKMHLIMDYICFKEGVTADSPEYQDKLTEILTQNGMASIDDALAAGITEWNVEATVKNACVMDVLMNNAVITEVE